MILGSLVFLALFIVFSLSVARGDVSFVNDGICSLANENNDSVSVEVFFHILETMQGYMDFLLYCMSKDKRGCI